MYIADDIVCVYCLGSTKISNNCTSVLIEHTTQFPKCPYIAHVIQEATTNRYSYTPERQSYDFEDVVRNWNSLPPVINLKQAVVDESMIEKVRKSSCDRTDMK